MSADRRVHARSQSRELVRYDRQGKWYVECEGLPRIHVTLVEAAAQAVQIGWTIYLRVPGGQRFDKLVRPYAGKNTP